MHRRRALVLFVNTTVGLITGALAAVLGAFAARPARSEAGAWLRAGGLADMTPNVPVPRVLAVPREDGWYRERARRTVFIVWDGGTRVHALSATCSHLGCQVRWDAATTRFRCPCHGGVFDAQGNVVEGPPPRPLDRVEARVDAAQRVIMVRV
jgi:menaquinol-cytochrome c reductase iron-sulfur subunit